MKRIFLSVKYVLKHVFWKPGRYTRLLKNFLKKIRRKLTCPRVRVLKGVPLPPFVGGDIAVLFG